MRYFRFAARELSVDSRGNPVDKNDPNRVENAGVEQTLMTEEKYLRLTREQQDALGPYEVWDDGSGTMLLVKALPKEESPVVGEVPDDAPGSHEPPKAGPRIRTKVQTPEGLVEDADKS